MVVCIEPSLGLFFRINTEPKWQTPVELRKSDHPFLDWDSNLECGEPLEFDDYVIEESLRDRGVIGRVLPSLAPQIFEAVRNARTVTAADKEAIRIALGC